MTRHRDVLDREIGTPPPSTVDIDAIVVRQRRRVRLLLVGLAGTAVALTVALTLGLAILPNNGGRNNTGHAGATPTSSAPVALTARQQEAARLTEVLTRLMTAALPGAEFLPIPEDDFMSVHPTETAVYPHAALVFVDEGAYFLAGAQIKDSGGIGTITISVGKEATLFRRDRTCLKGPQPLDMRVACDVEHGSDAALIEVVSSSSKYTKFKAFVVEIIRRDGNAVGVHINNSSGTGQNETFRAAPPLTLAQTKALTETPDLATVFS